MIFICYLCYLTFYLSSSINLPISISLSLPPRLNLCLFICLSTWFRHTSLSIWHFLLPFLTHALAPSFHPLISLSFMWSDCWSEDSVVMAIIIICVVYFFVFLLSVITTYVDAPKHIRGKRKEYYFKEYRFTKVRNVYGKSGSTKDK